MPNRHMKLVINVDNQKVDVLTPLASSSVTDALGYTPMNSSDRGATNGVASLTSGKVPASELPSYVDDVIEGYYYNNNFYLDPAHTQPIAGGGEPGKIYVDLAHDSSYRYTGSAYVEISQSITVDNAMSDSSTNPVQNRIITGAINNMRILISGTVNISASWASNGAMVTCTKGTETVTGTISAGACTLYLPQGPWTIAVTDQSTTVSDTIDVLLGYTYSVAIDDYHNMQRWVRNGTIWDHYSIGDQITVTRTGGDIVFDVVAFDVATPSDPTKTHSMTLVAHNLLDDYMMFDNREPSNPNSSRKDFGNNRYKDSNIRLWLNSDGAAGSWWTAQHTYDAAPNYASTKAGFMNGLDANFLDVIGETKIKAVKNTSTDGGGYEELVDKFYLPSTTEVGLSNENSIAEGALFPYFSSNTKRIKSKSGNSAYYWWLRTPYSPGSFSARYVNSDGTLSSYDVCNSYGVAPACNII